MKTYYFTLCQKDGGGHIEVIASNRLRAREIMFANRGTNWAFHYDSLSEIHPHDYSKKGEYQQAWTEKEVAQAVARKLDGLGWDAARSSSYADILGLDMITFEMTLGEPSELEAYLETLPYTDLITVINELEG